jgi:hypothetical protein
MDAFSHPLSDLATFAAVGSTIGLKIHPSSQILKEKCSEKLTNISKNNCSKSAVASIQWVKPAL